MPARFFDDGDSLIGEPWQMSRWEGEGGGFDETFDLLTPNRSNKVQQTPRWMSGSCWHTYLGT
jgi:hypothetical protein